MSSTIPENLWCLEEETRRRNFVGRAQELELLRGGLAGPGGRVFYIHGPAGIGKTSLLQAFVAEVTSGRSSANGSTSAT